MLKKTLNSAKDKFEKEKLFKLGNDNRKIRDYINVKLNRKIKKVRTDEIRAPGGGLVKNKMEAANLFNEFYAEIGVKLDREFRKGKGLGFLDKIKNNATSVFLDSVTEEKVSKIISVLTNKTGGWDGIHSKSPKAVSDSITGVLTYFFNLCIVKGVWPDNFKGFYVASVQERR